MTLLDEVLLTHTLDTASALREREDRIGTDGAEGINRVGDVSSSCQLLPQFGHSSGTRQEGWRTSTSHPRAPGFLLEKRGNHRLMTILGGAVAWWGSWPGGQVEKPAAAARPEGDGGIPEFLGAAPKPWRRQQGWPGPRSSLGICGDRSAGGLPPAPQVPMGGKPEPGAELVFQQPRGPRDPTVTASQTVPRALVLPVVGVTHGHLLEVLPPRTFSLLLKTWLQILKAALKVPLLWVEWWVSPIPNSFAGVLTPGTSECDLI